MKNTKPKLMIQKGPIFGTKMEREREREIVFGLK